MADTTDESGATGAASGGAAKPFRIFTTEDEFNAHAAKIRHEAERKARTVTADERATMDAMTAELEARKADWKIPEPRYTTGVLAKYARLAQGAEKGAVTSA